MNSIMKRAVCLLVVLLLSSQLTACATGGGRQASQKSCPAGGCPAPQQKY